MKRKRLRRLKKLLAVPLLLAVLLFFTVAIDSLGQSNAAEEKIHLEEALAKAAVACYAIEGAYPPSAEYLTEHYGIQINTDRFVVKYELYASNLMPDITVIEIK